MNLLGRTTQPGDLDQCINAIIDRYLYSEEQLKQLRSMWDSLLSRDIARSAVVFDDAEPRRVLAFAISAPLKRLRFDDILDERSACITKVLLDEWSSNQEPFLDEREYASANASAGLNTFVLNNAYSDTLSMSSITNVLSKSSENFMSQYAGCRLRAIANESFGVSEQYAIDLGMQVIRYARAPDREKAACPSGREPSYIALMTREHAERRPGDLTMNTLFLRFTPPLFSFNAVERRLLRFAIEGESDLRIADLLQIAPRTLKTRWADIYVTMQMVTGIPSGGLSGHRGAEARRHVLRYIRHHPEELHAYRSESYRAEAASVSRAERSI